MKTRTNYVVIAIALLSLIALVGSAQAAANLEVTKNHPGYVFSNLTNVMTAQVTNSGDTNAADFNVSINVTSDATGASLYANKTTGVSVAWGATETVSLGTWMPTTVENITINVTADCDNTTVESDETDNSRVEVRNTTGGCADSGYTNTMLEKECFGYRGQHPLTEAYVGGSNVIYTVGDYKYKMNTTVNFEIGAPGGDDNRITNTTADIPAGATIEQATLYLYHAWRKGQTPEYPAWTMNFTNSAGTYTVTEATNYTDCKGFGTSYSRERLYGTIVYDVTDYVTGNGSYTANVTGDIYPYESSTDYGYASGMALMVVYDDGSGCKRYRIAHGHDRLATYYQYSATSKSSYHVLAEDATTSATLTDANPSGDVTSAKLFTATVDAVDYDDGSPGKESLKCNDCDWIEGAWSNDGMGNYNYPIGFSRDDVTGCLSGAGSDETVQFQERDGSYKNGYSVVLAVLVAEEDPIESYGDSVYFKKNVLLARRALGEPNNRGALMRRNAKIAIELEETIPDCTKVSVWVRRVAVRPPSFDVGVSSNGVDWTVIGSETCTSWGWTRYDFTGDWDDVKYIGISKPGTPRKPKLMGLDAVRAEGCN